MQSHVLFSHYARLRYCSPLIVSISWLTRAGGDGSVGISLRQGAGYERENLLWARIQFLTSAILRSKA
jgi:hypothetical protein